MTPTAGPAAVEQARANMIAQQIRPWDVLSQDVLDLLHVLRREDFVPPAYKSLAFVDTDIPLVVDANGASEDTGETMLAPKFEARILQEIAVQPDETVLEIGTGSGYMAALLARFAARVVTIEIDPRLKAFAEANLARAGVEGVRVELGNGLAGWPTLGEVDVLVVSGSLPFLPDALKKQLRVGGRIAAVLGDAPAMSAVIGRRVSADAWEMTTLFETVVKRLREAPHVSRFEF
jgi:protein-L-isoaspartate(D-aspartate) O-methyltransferase